MEKRKFKYQGSESDWIKVSDFFDKEMEYPSEKVELLDVVQTGLGLAISALRLASSEYNDLYSKQELQKIAECESVARFYFHKIGLIVDKQYK